MYFPPMSAKRMPQATFTFMVWVTSIVLTVCCQSLEYLKINGLKLPQAINSANPAKYAEVLLAHMVRFSAVLQGHFASTIGWDALNISFAPYLAAMTDKEVKQFAQMLSMNSHSSPPHAVDRLCIPIYTYIMKCRRIG